jgi:hypothetical protein
MQGGVGTHVPRSITSRTRWRIQGQLDKRKERWSWAAKAQGSRDNLAFTKSLVKGLPSSRLRHGLNVMQDLRSQPANADLKV